MFPAESVRMNHTLVSISYFLKTSSNFLPMFCPQCSTLNSVQAEIVHLVQIRSYIIM